MADYETSTIVLDPELKERLRRASFEHRVSMSEIAREGIAIVLDRMGRKAEGS